VASNQTMQNPGNFSPFLSASAPVLDFEDARARDEALARLLQQSATEEVERKRIAEEKDAAFALQLLMEEKLQIGKEAELARVSEIVAHKLHSELALAQQIEEEERKKYLEMKDLELARRVAEEEKAKLATLNLHDNRNQLTNNLTAQFKSSRQHAVAIHNHHCNCGVTATYNNNHIYEIHNKYCTKRNCPTKQFLVPNNQGLRHRHDGRCCTIDHIHSISCHCVYRQHLRTTGHMHPCCQALHAHNDYCHCVYK